jgi:uncharacterized Zn-binding protein involved in type VI secretion
MTSRTWTRRALTFTFALVFLNAGVTFALAGGAVQEQEPKQEPIGLLTVTGRVTVNGQPAATGDIVSSGSTVETAKGSSAVVSLGKLGRVEALPETRMKLRFKLPAGDEETRTYEDSTISILLDSGSVRVQTGPGVSANITTKNG